jgi:transposase
MLVEVWSQDECRIGLIPIVRQVWAPRGKRPVTSNTTKYEWVYVYGFVRPATGEPFWLIMPTVNTTVMNRALQEFAKAVNPDGNKIIILLLDGAGWHTTNKLSVPDGIRLLPLPAYTPELQPVETAWPLLKEPLANKVFSSLDEIKMILVDRCNYLTDHPEVLKGQVGFGWVARLG